MEVYDIAEWKALMLAAQNPPMRQARREYICLHCGKKKQFIRLNSHRRQGCPKNKSAAGVPIREKMYPNLLTDSTARDLEVGADPAILIRLYNGGWYRDDGGDAVVDEAARQEGTRPARLHRQQCLRHQGLMLHARCNNHRGRRGKPWRRSAGTIVREACNFRDRLTTSRSLTVVSVREARQAETANCRRRGEWSSSMGRAVLHLQR
jgi:hypothetical protein